MIKKLIAVVIFSLCATAGAATLGKHTYIEDKVYHSCVSQTVPAITGTIVVGATGRPVQVDWSAMVSAYAVKMEIWWYGPSSTSWSKVAQFPDFSVPATNNQDWIACIEPLGSGCNLNAALAGTWTTGGLVAGTHKFQLHYSKWPTSNGCNYFSNRTLHLQEIIP